MHILPIFLLTCLVAFAPLARLEANGSKDSKASQQPDSVSAEQDVMNAFSQMDQALVQDAEEISPIDEYYLGRAVSANILETYMPYIYDPALTEYLNTICRALVLNSPKPLIYNGYHLMLLDSPEINAFATSGGHIFLTRGLIDAANSEDALAAVIAHEIAHIQLRHGIVLVEDFRLSQELTSAADRASSIASRGASLEERKLLFTQSVRELVNTMVINGYSQAQEFEADTMALSLLAAAGYTPASLIEVLQVLEIRQRTQPGGFNKTHPSPALRIANVEKSLFKYPVPDTRSFRRVRFQFIK
jgi:predicted Zn-dependent protease